MAEIDIMKLEMKLSALESRIEVADTFNDINLVRSYVAEGALAFMIAGQALDFDQLEKIMLEELGGDGKRGQRVRSAVASLRDRSHNPTIPQPD